MPFVPLVDPASFRSAVTLGVTPESVVLEFKSRYRWQRSGSTASDVAGQAEELCRDIAQFANTAGGTLLVGVGELDAGGGRKVAGSIDPVDAVDGFKQWVEQAIRNHLVPSTFSRSVHTIVLPDGVVVAVNVRPSVHLVALWHEDGKKGIEYLYHTDHGKDWLNPDEVERHIMNGSRAIKIAITEILDKVVTKEVVELAPPLRHLHQVSGRGDLVELIQTNVHILKAGCNDREIELRWGSVGVRVPYGLVREAWMTSAGNVGLCLDVALVARDQTHVTLEPLPR